MVNLTEVKKQLSHLSFAKILAGALSLFLLSFLLSYALLGRDRSFDAVGRIKHWLVSTEHFGLSVATEGCDSSESCYTFIKNRAQFEDVSREGSNMDLSAKIPSSLGKNAFVMLRFGISITDDIIDDVTDALVVSFPDISYNRADVYWNGHFEKRSFGADRFFIAIDKARLVKGHGIVEVLLEVEPVDASGFINWHEAFFLTTNKEYNNYFKQLTLIQLGQGEQIGMIARVALAALMLLFFVILDGSESALGLSLAMGFEAAGMCFGNVSLKHQWIVSSPLINVTKLTFYTLSDFIGLYFLLYIAGKRKFSIAFWMAIGAVVGLSYGVTMTYFDEQIPMVKSFWIPRVLLTSGVGIVFCLIEIVKSIRKNERDLWKTVAITFAIAGMGVVVLEAVGSMFPGFDDSDQVNTIMAIGKSVKAYVLALSGLAAIASMRKELRGLEAEREKARKMVHELELGRDMQQALLQVPALPQGVEVSVSHIAAAYVSGDTYFFYWNEKNQVLTMLLNDVPGHGLQAALKAYACNVIAKTVWSQGGLMHDRRVFRSLFPVYQEQVVQMLRHQDDSMPFNAFTGVEIFIRQQIAVVYRSNYNEAVVMSPGENGVEISVLACRSGDYIEVPLKPGTCFLLVSDGLIQNSKAQKQFVDQLRTAFAGNMALGEGLLTAKEILDVVLDPEKILLSDVDDDRTILILRWTGLALVAAA